jgi:hypothetical protein
MGISSEIERVVVRGFGVVALLVWSSLVAGCAHVAPYERGSLAHPTMTTDDTATALEQHVRAISEGASGGVSGGGGGCGCN